VQRKIIITGDGSKTIQLIDWNEQYHSIHGAIQEAKHVFIDNLVKFKTKKTELQIFEMGFGTGLNAFLTCQIACELNLAIDYYSLEAFPLQMDEVKELNYTELLNDQTSILEMLHQANWNEFVEINSNFGIAKIGQTLENWESGIKTFDFIFYDAFGPRVQPHLWTVEIFEKLYAATKKGGIFLTYCAKGQVRRDLQSVGYKITRLPGPPGKREMLMGEK
jgi:tRNA U34 5-methylaminomethyl-2-thiouridine-forming methyltransferase MnmC